MKYLISVILLSFVNKSLQLYCSRTVQSQVAFATDEFGLDLLKNLPTEKDNSILSPMSISVVMAMLSLGAKGNTFVEINRALHFDDVKSSDRRALHKAFQKLIEVYGENNSNYSLSLANRLFAQKSYELKKKFLDETEKYYKATVEAVDFTSGDAEEIINEWVEKQTSGKIKDLFQPGSLSSSSILVLVNAIYFKGKWKTQFEKQKTIEMDFFVSKNETTKVQMMRLTSEFLYTENKALKIQMLRMPYDGNDLSMNIILPEQDGLRTLISQLDSKKLRTLSKGMSSRKVNVQMPRFKLEMTYSLQEELEKLGIKDAFTSKADLSGIAEGSMEVSEIIHKAFIDVNEEGTEAAAATAVVVVKAAAVHEDRKDFVLNRPFLLFITDTRFDDEITFIATFNKP